MTNERRKQVRAYIHLPAFFEAEQGVFEGTLCDLSWGGCFILTSAEVAVKEFIKVGIELPQTGWVHLWGEVCNSHDGIGFGVRFNGLPTEGKEAINGLSTLIHERIKI